MQVPLEISFHGIDHSASIEELVRKRAAKLEDFCDHLNSCRIALERPNAHPRSGSSWRVRIDMRVAGGHEVVVDRGQMNGTVRDELYDAVNDAFDIAQRRLKRLSAKQNGHVKAHAEQFLTGVVEKKMEDYGFILGVDGREIYFHENSILNESFEDLEIGMGVAYVEEAGNEGPQASTVRVVDSRHGRRVTEDRPSDVTP